MICHSSICSVEVVLGVLAGGAEMHKIRLCTGRQQRVPVRVLLSACRAGPYLSIYSLKQARKTLLACLISTRSHQSEPSCRWKLYLNCPRFSTRRHPPAARRSTHRTSSGPSGPGKGPGIRRRPRIELLQVLWVLEYVSHAVGTQHSNVRVSQVECTSH